MGKLILNLAMSLDGYIADMDGGYGWIQGSGKNPLDTEKGWDFKEFLEGVDLVLMGRKSFDGLVGPELRGKEILVASRKRQGTLLPSDLHGPVTFIGGLGEDITGIVQERLQEEGIEVYLYGGGETAWPFLEAGMVDELILGLIPVTLGQGIPLFRAGGVPQEWTLVDRIIEEGIVILHYHTRNPKG